MTIRNITLSLFLSLSLSAFAQDSTKSYRREAKRSYLDSIKSTFVHDNIAACVDSLWMKELTNVELYEGLSNDIKNINIDENVEYDLSTDLLKERLKAMDEKSPFNIEYNKGLENLIKSFLKNRKNAFERLMAISEYYFPMFEEAMARKNVPLEIKYLAVVESALNPKAVSRVGATGLWQFMYHTGKQYDLDINTYVDERSDPLKASDAAAQYMKNMHEIFGDWDLVLASYNSGPGNVAKAIRRSGGHQNFWNIRKHLPKETQGYVPAFLATMYIYEYHKEHGIVPNRAVIKHFGTDTIQVRKQMSFRQISSLLDMPVSQLQLLNPSYKRDVIPYVTGQKHYLRLPNDKVAVFTSNESKIYAFVSHEEGKRERQFQSRGIANRSSKKSDFTVKYYTVQRGDDLSDIAEKFGVAVNEIKKTNRLRGNSIARGKRLKIRVKDTLSVDVREGALASSVKKEPVMEEEAQTVAEVPVKESKKESKKSNKLEPKESDDKVASTVKNVETYKVKKGDNLASIAEKFNVEVAAIKKSNKIKGTRLNVGDKLKIERIENTVAAADKKETKSDKNNAVAKNEHNGAADLKGQTKTDVGTAIEVYSVQKGETLHSIAKKFDVTVDNIKDWNSLQDNNISLGMKLYIDSKTTSIISDEEEANPNVVTQEYTVEKGDNLLSIARKFKASIADIKLWNELQDNNIKLGQTLIVAKSAADLSKDKVAENSKKSNAKNKQEVYYVKKGDSLYSISKKYPGVTISDIKRLNGISEENLKPGMKLKING